MENDTIVKKFDIELIKDADGNYYITDMANKVTFDVDASSDEEALKKFDQFAELLDSTNVNIFDVDTVDTEE